MPEEKPLEEFDDGIGFVNILGQLFVPRVPTDEERLAKAMMRSGQIRDRLTRLERIKKKKRLRRKGAEVSDDEDDPQRLLDELSHLSQPDLGPIVREGTPPIDDLEDDDLLPPKALPEGTAPSVGMGGPLSIGAPEEPKKEEKDLSKYNVEDLYDAAREKYKPAKRVEEEGDRAADDDFDQEFSDAFEAKLNEQREPTRDAVVAFVKKEVLRCPRQHKEIMCCVEMRLQSDELSAIESYTAWCICDAILKRGGGPFLRAIRESLPSLVEEALPSVRYGPKWRRPSRDMVRSWEDVVGKKEMRSYLDSLKN